MKLSILLILSLLFISSTCKMNFQRNLWMYWQTDIETAPLITRVSYQKMKLAAQNANWTLILVNGSTIKNYLPQYDRFIEVTKKGYRNTVQQRSDILRIALVQQNGGVWIDFASILFDDLSWLSDDKIFDHLIINKIGSNKDDPDMLMMGQGYHQSPLSYYNEDERLVVDQYFGMAIHFIAAKKKSPIMKDWKQKMYNVSSLSYRQAIPQLIQKPLFFHYIDRPDFYYSGNIALESTLQLKQIQLDNELKLGQNRITAYQKYKIWMFHGQVGPIVMIKQNAIQPIDLFFQTKQQIQQRTGKLWFYLKVARWLRDRIQQKQRITIQYLKQKNKTVQNIIEKGPLKQQCELYFIVKGSILYTFYNESKHQNQISSIYITTQQRQRLKWQCLKNKPSIYQFQRLQYSKGQLPKAQREIFKYDAVTFKDKLRVFWMANRLVIGQGIWNWIIVWFWLCIYLLIRFLVRLVYKILNCKNSNKIINEQNGKALNMRQLIILLIRSIQIGISISFYESIQVDGKYPQYQGAYLTLLTILIIDWFINNQVKQIENNNKNNQNSNIKNSRLLLINSNKIIQQTQLFVYVPLCYVIVIHFDIMYWYSYYHTFTVGVGSMLLIQLIKQIWKRKISIIGLQFITCIIQFVKWFIIIVFTIFYIINSSRYLRYGDKYIKQYMILFICKGFYIIFIVSIVYIIMRLFVYNELIVKKDQYSHRQQQQGNKITYQNVIQDNNIEQNNTQDNNIEQNNIPQNNIEENNIPQNNILQNNNKQQNNKINNINQHNKYKNSIYNKKQLQKIPKNTIHLLLSSLIIISIIYKSYIIFNQGINAPSQFGYFNTFYFFIIIFNICRIGIKLNIKFIHNINLIIITYIFTYSLIIAYIIYGYPLTKLITFKSLNILMIYTILLINTCQLINQQSSQQRQKSINQQIPYQLVQTNITI